MACSDSGVAGRQLDIMLAGLERCSFYDFREGCRIVEVGCKRCGRIFDEELEAAKDKVSRGRDLLCLSCDPDALNSAVSAVVVRVGWKQ